MLVGCGGLFYCNTTNRFLFLLRSNSGKFSDTWGLPGGKVDKNETVGNALSREINEEMGVYLYDKKIIPLEKYTSNSNSFTYHTFIIITEKEFVPTLNYEHKGYCWVPIDDYPRPLHPGVFQTFTIDVILDKIKLVQQQYYLNAEIGLTSTV